MSPSNTQVLVVGAGPVGLLTALSLAEQGLSVQVVDSALSRERLMSPAVILHRRTLRLLADFGLALGLLWQGNEVRKLAVYADGELRTMLNLSQSDDVFDCALTVPQTFLQQVLCNALAQRGVPIHFGYRVEALDQHAASVNVLLRESAPIPRNAPVQQPNRRELHAQFVVGADGRNSTVRDALEIPFVQAGASETFAMFDTLSESERANNMARLFVRENVMVSMYPLRDGRLRWSFQLPPGLTRIPEPPALLASIAGHGSLPEARHQRVDWVATAEFPRALAQSAGRYRVWLAGDAAHVASPLGAQSLNAGLHDACVLAGAIGECVRTGELSVLAEQYAGERREVWRAVLGFNNRASAPPGSAEWKSRYAERLLPALPASQEDFDLVAKQLGFMFCAA
jgi:2-polyprenyl-6-methoxyphenol hydroxylase-like FAD-dependent oxidoreductase